MTRSSKSGIRRIERAFGEWLAKNRAVTGWHKVCEPCSQGAVIGKHRVWRLDDSLLPYARDVIDKQQRIEGGNMADECVVAIFNNLERAQQAVHILDRGRFPRAQISLVTKSLRNQTEALADLQMGDDSARDAAIGAGLGAVSGVLAGIAVAAVSGAAVVFLAGPIGIGLAGGLVGAYLGAMGGWGVHHERIAHYEALVEQGRTLVIAHGSPLQIVEADRILKETDPVEIHVYTRTDSESPEVNPQEKIEA